MADINLDQLMASKSAGMLSTPEEQSDVELVRAEQASQIKPADRAAIDKIKSTVDLKNAQTSIVYASQTKDRGCTGAFSRPSKTPSW